jgi:hypothetical protein
MRAAFPKQIRENIVIDFEEAEEGHISELDHNTEADMKHFLKEIEKLQLP